MKVYRIMDKETRLFSTGRTWNKTGKFWSKLSHLKCHLNTTESHLYDQRVICIVSNDLTQFEIEII